MELLSPANSSSRESLSYRAVIRCSACLIAILAPFRLAVRLWYSHYTTSPANVQRFPLDQSHNLILKGLGGLGRLIHIRPVAGIADASAEPKCSFNALHESLAFWKCWNDIVSLVASIICVSSLFSRPFHGTRPCTGYTSVNAGIDLVSRDLCPSLFSSL